MSLPNKLFTQNRVITGTLITVMATGAALMPGVAQQQAKHDKQVKATTTLTESTGLHHEQLSVYDNIVKERFDNEAAAVVAQGQDVVAQDAAKTDVTPVKTAINKLSEYDKIGVDTVRARTDIARNAIQVAVTAAVAHDQAVAAQAAADAAAAAQAQANANTPDGARAVARTMAANDYGWGDGEFQCLDNLWSKESGWDYQASNGSSGATGIPQSLPGSKMASAGSDWATNATTQIKWGLGYIAGSYGTPCSAWSKSQSSNWY